MPPVFERYRHLGLDLSASGVLTVTLRNGQRRNAITAAMDAELQHIFTDGWTCHEVKVIVLTGDGDAFCAGADLTELPDDSDTALGRLSGGAKRIFYSMLDCEKPLIAKVRGPAYGLGANLALACDIVIASEDARFADSHVRVGLAPGDGGAALWPLLVGFARAKELLLTGRPITAARAAEIGLIAQVVPGAELDAAVTALSDELAALPPLAVAYTKSAINTMLRQMLGGAFESALAYDLLTLRTDAHRAAAARFGK